MILLQYSRYPPKREWGQDENEETMDSSPHD